MSVYEHTSALGPWTFIILCVCWSLSSSTPRAGYSFVLLNLNVLPWLTLVSSVDCCGTKGHQDWDLFTRNQQFIKSLHLTAKQAHRRKNVIILFCFVLIHTMMCRHYKCVLTVWPVCEYAEWAWLNVPLLLIKENWWIFTLRISLYYLLVM